MKRSVIEYIRCAADKYGDKIAYHDTVNKFSFRQVEEFASRIASGIIALQHCGEPVIVFAERDAYTPIEYLGVVMSGCYYIPIDSSQNTGRIIQMIDSSCSKLMITRKHLVTLVSELGYIGEILTVEDAFATEINNSALNRVEKKVFCQMPLYAIFTSGSTGNPKGVLTSHISLMNYVEAVDEVLNLVEDDVIGNQSPLDYIAAIRDIYLPLISGASTVIIPGDRFAVASRLAETIRANNISILCWSVSGLETGLHSGLLDQAEMMRIRKILFSGSSIPGRVLKKWQQCFPDAEFINQYGPTEATASCTYYIVKEKATDDTVLPIGVPYRNYNIILLNEDGTETRFGDVGEICVAGLGVTLGYYRDKKLTEESFVQNPLNDTYSETIYKTGDLGKYDNEGLLVFCGRKDRQIELHGHRIGLDEIENIAKRINKVDDCVAVYDESQDTLCLVYTGSAEKNELIKGFQERMPSFIALGEVVKVDSIPHLASGKIDVLNFRKIIENTRGEQ